MGNCCHQGGEKTVVASSRVRQFTLAQPKACRCIGDGQIGLIRHEILRAPPPTKQKRAGFSPKLVLLALQKLLPAAGPGMAFQLPVQLI